MKKITLLLLGLILTTGVINAQELLAHWPMNVTNSDDAISVNSNITAANIGKSGTSGSSTTLTTKGFANWATSTSIDLNYYLELSITPNAGYSVTVTQLHFTHNRQTVINPNSAPKKYEIRASVDNFSNFTTLATGTIPNTATENNITGLNVPVNGGETLKIRLYGYEAELVPAIQSTRHWEFANNNFGFKLYSDVPPTLSTNKVEAFNPVVYFKNETLFLNAGNNILTNVSFYDMLGRLLTVRKHINAPDLSISNLNINNKMILIKIETENASVIKRVIF
ncbi:hypothetical protein [Aestuariibaculum sediminum]|uniref:Uncharacterized protein n=1 Tax=Aestuariibaculum sediminum TaxID=2770637 RepID=A0A8J6U6W7_9FLAO|nr:hypothetical protein [Aestuariibaculum sediminum]MBD0831103.1 hypothetical protein [Aestuariibaculum sediminum]